MQHYFVTNSNETVPFSVLSDPTYLSKECTFFLFAQNKSLKNHQSTLAD